MNRQMRFFLAAIAAAMCAMGADLLSPGTTGEIATGGIIKSAFIASTNATQTATVKAVYEWPIYGTAERQTITQHRRDVWSDKVEILTNWCDWVTTTAVTNIAGGVTNVQYYAGITTVTNRILTVVEEPVTNRWYERVITGGKAVTNTLYSLTATNGIGSSTDRKLIGVGGRLIVEDWPVTLFWEQ